MKPILTSPWPHLRSPWFAALAAFAVMSGAASARTGNGLQRETRVESPAPPMRAAANGIRSVQAMSPRSFTAKSFAAPSLPQISYKASASQSVSDLPEIYGSVIYADGWTQQDNAMGMYRIGTSDNVPFKQMGTTRIDATSGGVAIGNVYWACYTVDIYGYNMVYVLSYDTDTWSELTYNVRDVPVVSTGVAYDRTTGNVYGCFRSDDNKGYVFGTVDYAAGKRTAIKPLERMWSAVAATRDGVIYAIDELGDLYTVDKVSGNMSLVGKTGLMATHPSSACIDYRSGRMFYALTSAPNGSLYEIDRTTGRPTLIYHFPKNEEVVGMFIPMPDADDAAPDQVSDLTLNFPAGTLSGSVSFTAPGVTFGGETATGSVGYVVEANGATVANGTTTYGAATDVPVKLTKPGTYNFSVYLYNAAGNGPAVEASMFVGNDLPMTPELTSSISNGEISLSWKPVESSVNGGYINLDALTYTVTRYPDEKVIAENTTLTSVKDAPGSDGTLTGYYYTVTARAGSVVSAEAVTPTFWLGFVTPPYSVKFNSETSFDAFPIVDANADGTTWTWNANQKALAVQFNRVNDTDDWLISPPFKLEKGKMYMFTASMHTYLGNPETMEIRWGNAPSPAGLTQTLMEPTVIKNKNADNYSYYLLPEDDGIYYVGIHGMSPKSSSFYLFADGVTVGAGVEADIPDAPDAFMVTPDYDGALKATVTMKAPVKAVNGGDLASITKIELRRGGKVLKTFDAPKPGDALEYADAPSAAGYYKYDAVAYNASGAGKRVEATVFVGANEPASPTGVKIAETAKPGEVTISWQQVTTDRDGKAINPALVTYTILAAGAGDDAVNVAEKLTGTSHTFTAVKAGEEQMFVGYAVQAVTAGGTSLMAPTAIIPVGPAYETPFNESFANSFAASIIRSEDREAIWSIYDDTSGIPTYDSDNGMAAMFGEFSGADATLYTGKISLKNVASPALTLYAYNIAGSDADLNELEIAVSTGAGFDVVKNVVMSQLGDADGWYPVVVSLEAYAGNEVQLALRGVTRTRKFTLVDNISVGTLPAYNLRAGMISAPAMVKPDAEFNVGVMVENIGLNTAAGYTVKLLRNGKVVAQETPASLACGESVMVEFAQSLTVADTESNIYQAEIEFAADTDASDNITAQCAVELSVALHPSPRNLTGVATAEGAKLTWTEPDLAAAIPNAVTDTFEDYESWAKSGIGAWTMVDVDKAGIGQVNNVVLPGIDFNTNVAWFVADDTAPGLPAESFAAHSGHKYLSTMFCLPRTDGEEMAYVTNDDWAISPLLYGGAQTVSFVARSANPNTAEESFEVWYSTEDSTTPADFKLLGKEEKVPGLWTTYSFKLPDGAKRFAIRYNHTYGLMLHVDDVTYIPSGKADLTIEGYNVYRDGKRVNTSLIKETTWTDAEYDADAKASYAVSAHYGKDGESRPGNAIIIDNSGIDGVEASAAVAVIARAGEIVVSNADGFMITVCDAAGRTVAISEGTAHSRIAVAPGVYVVTVGNSTFKVAVF